MDGYTEQCWRIAQHTAFQRDLEITIVHFSLDHFMKHVRKYTSKDVSKRQVIYGDASLRVLIGMWLIALVINRSTLDERRKDPDKKNFVLQHVSVTLKGQCDSTIEVEVRSTKLVIN